MGIGNLKQKLLDHLPKPIATKLYLIRNNAIHVEGNPYLDYTFSLSLPRRNKLWIERMKSGHEPAICEWFHKHLKNDDVYIDVGSAFGFFPALISSINPKVQIHAFEAGWQQFYFLKKNADLFAELNKWHLVNKYVGNQNSNRMIKLDDYVDQMGIEPSIIQIDVDGAENMVLSGARKIIDRKKTEFLLELHPLILHEFNTNIEEVMAHFYDGYQMKILTGLRDNNMCWSEDKSLIQKDDNPYLYIYPANQSRM